MARSVSIATVVVVMVMVVVVVVMVVVVVLDVMQESQHLFYLRNLRISGLSD
jgi:hypothetical protein